MPPGSYRSEWVDIISGKVMEVETFTHQGGPRKMKAHYPDGGGGALRIFRQE